ncbi:MAG: hypothetical protein AAGA58_19885 [Verrucomicrobiota bacterium]
MSERSFRRVPKTLILSLVLMVLSVPWWFTGGEGPVFLGMPGWAVFAVAGGIAYACAVAWLMGAQWKQEGESETEEEDS